MSSINQIVSELAHSVRGYDNAAVKQSLKLAIVHARNKLIRQSYENHGYADASTMQRVKISLIDVPDGDLEVLKDYVCTVKRSVNKVPKPTRLPNHTPFQTVKTVGYKNAKEIPYANEAVAQYYKSLPGMCAGALYDYINGYLYIMFDETSSIANINNIIITSIFENPSIIKTETVKGIEVYNGIKDDDEFLIPEDMIDDLKKIVLETFNAQLSRDDAESMSANKSL